MPITFLPSKPDPRTNAVPRDPSRWNRLGLGAAGGGRRCIRTGVKPVYCPSAALRNGGNRSVPDTMKSRRGRERRGGREGGKKNDRGPDRDGFLRAPLNDDFDRLRL